jgi:hypothetical protein
VSKAPLALMSAHPAWCVFPIKCGQKYPPLFEDNLRRASNSPTQVSQWAAEFPGCNWGLACAKSHLIVMDVDQKPTKFGALTLERLELIHGQLPETFGVQSPSGGRHLYFTETNIVRHRMKVGAFGRDVDSTNYILLPGSVLSGVGSYRTINKAMVAPAPDWFAEYLDAPDVADADQEPAVELDTADIITRAIYHLRNDAKPSLQGQNGEFRLLMVAGDLKDMGVSKDMTIQLLNEHYNVPGKCEPQWECYEGAIADRLDIKVENAWNYLRQTQPGSRSPQADFGDEPVDTYGLEATTAWWREFESKQNYVMIDGERVRIVKGYGHE